MNTVEILSRICSAPGVSGFEKETDKAITACLEGIADEIKTDTLGSLVAVINPGAGDTVALSAHKDKIGLVVTEVCDDGFVKIADANGSDVRIAAAQRVKIYGRETLDGCVTSVPPHLSGKKKDDIKFSDLSVDCFLTGDEAKELIAPGDRVEMRTPFTALSGTRVSSPFLDNAAGCAAVINALKQLKSEGYDKTVCAVFTTREESGGQGGATGFYDLDPKAVLICDVSFAKQPGAKNVHTSLGSGAMIGFSPVLDPGVSALLVAAAEKENLPYTREVMGRSTGTDADDAPLTKGGIKTGLVSIPLRNMHTPAETADISDVDTVGRLFAAAVKEGLCNV